MFVTLYIIHCNGVVQDGEIKHLISLWTYVHKVLPTVIYRYNRVLLWSIWELFFKQIILKMIEILKELIFKSNHVWLFWRIYFCTLSQASGAWSYNQNLWQKGMAITLIFCFSIKMKSTHTFYTSHFYTAHTLKYSLYLSREIHFMWCIHPRWDKWINWTKYTVAIFISSKTTTACILCWWQLVWKSRNYSKQKTSCTLCMSTELILF